MNINQIQAPPSSNWTIPSGYTIGTYQDGKQYLVPTFLVKATDVAIRAQELKGTYKVFQSSNGVSDRYRQTCDSLMRPQPLSMEDLPHVLLGNGGIMAPPLPVRFSYNDIVYLSDCRRISR